MSVFDSLTSRTEVPALIGFADLTHFTSFAKRHPDAEVAAFIDEFYERIVDAIEPAGGTVVKFLGDAALILFPEALADPGVLALLEMKRSVDAWIETRGEHSELVVKIHFGTVIAGPYGGRDRKTFDVIGRHVNTAATLDVAHLGISAQAFRKLGPDSRKRFKKHTPPVTYIRVEDRHR